MVHDAAFIVCVIRLGEIACLDEDSEDCRNEGGSEKMDDKMDDNREEYDELDDPSYPSSNSHEQTPMLHATQSQPSQYLSQPSHLTS